MGKGCLQIVFNLLVLVWLIALSVVVFGGGTEKVLQGLSVPPDMLRSVEDAMQALYEGKPFSPEMTAKLDELKEKIKDRQMEFASELNSGKE